ncbi:MAG: ABC transporter permease [Deltaproteobacteria bacterium]
MLKYIIKRLLWTIPTLLGVLLLLFGLTHLLPGDPASIMLGPRATPELINQLRARLHLDAPLYVQVWYYISGVVHFDLGHSICSGLRVSQLIADALPHTVALAISALGIAAVIGIPTGAFAATHQSKYMDGTITLFSLVAVAIPDFVAGLLLMLVFCVQIPIFPVLGTGESGNTLDVIRHLILPATALAIGWMGYLSRLTRESMLEVLDSDYIRTARAFAAPRRFVAYKYALKNAIIVPITVMGLGVGKLLGGAVFIEIIFNRPGLGSLIVNAVYALDLPVVQGGILVASLLFVLANLVADLSYAVVDPRIQYD